MTDDLTLSIDLGTSSVRTALLDRRGNIVALASRGFAQTIPRHGWAEQSASAWWNATRDALRELTAATPARIAAICTCGQMHGTALLNADGGLATDAALLWNDKRSIPQVDAWAARHPFADHAAASANPPTPAWPAFKLAWLRDHAPEILAATTTLLTPKDYINFCLSGVRATDWTEASTSFLADARTGCWSHELVASFGLSCAMLPPIHHSADVIGSVSERAAAETGLAPGIPILAGGGDLPVALIGSGAAQVGLASDISGTSSIATLLRPSPLLDPLVANVAAPGGLWGAFTLVDAGGDSVRWSTQAIGNGTPEDSAEAAPPGANGLFFLPFLSGERMGPARNSRAQFFGLTASHGKPELHRAVLEGVALALARQFERIAGLAGRPDCFVTAGGGGRSDLWLKIRASAYDRPILVPRVLESGLVGCAMLARQAVDGIGLDTAMATMTAIKHEVAPQPEWVELYARRRETYGRLVDAMAPLYDELDRLQ